MSNTPNKSKARSEKKAKRTASREHRAHRPRVAWAFTLTVVALQSLLLGTLFLASHWTPPHVRIIEAGWAWLNSNAFVPLGMLLLGGPLCTALAMKLDRRKTLPLAGAWIAFGLILVIGFGAQAQTLMRSMLAHLPF